MFTMSYYSILGLGLEPFSTSPDPEFFYESREHHAALVRLMIDIHLKRGFSVLLGDVGMGKTTLSRKLAQMLKEKSDIEFHMILDPTYQTEELFWESLIRAFKIDIRDPAPTILDFKHELNHYLFRRGVEENKNVVLLIDEAQKLNVLSLEILRVLLNYETNERKLLQLILIGQMELLPRICSIRNLWDRISLKYVLNPLDLNETTELIDFRLKKAGYQFGPPFFTEEAVKEIHQHTQGYPRRISMLCHHALKMLMVTDKKMVDGTMIKEIIEGELGILSHNPY